ncbi:MAG: alkylmercury lyase family protein [Candidatus Hydrothermarchaeales archaeon]
MRISKIAPDANERARSVLESIHATVDIDAKWGKSLSPDEDEIRRFILTEFPSLGRVPTMEEIKEGLGLTTTDVSQSLETLNELDIIYMKDDRILGAYPFSSEPTPYLVTFKGREKRRAYALCAIDALGIPFMFGEDVDIESSCAHCSGKIKIKVEDGRIIECEPKEALVWIGLKYSCHAATSLCTSLIFFQSEEHLLEWRAENPSEDGEALTLSEALYVGKELFEARLGLAHSSTGT